MIMTVLITRNSKMFLILCHGITTRDGPKKEEYVTAVDVAMQHDLMRSIKKAPFLLMESCPSATNWKPINNLRNRECFWLLLFRQLLTVQTVFCTSSSARAVALLKMFHGAVIDHYGGDDTRVFKEVTEVGEALEQIKETVGTNMKSQAAVLYDRENDWAIADVQGPRNEDMHYRAKCAEELPRAERTGIECRYYRDGT